MARSWGLTRSASTVQAVLGSNCYLRFEISSPPLGEKIRRIVKGHIVLTVCIGFIVAVAVAVLVVVRRKAGNTTATASAAEGKQ